MSLSVIPEFDDTLHANGDAVPEQRDGDQHSEAELLADLMPDDDAPATRLSDARADVPISETSERFLRALLTKVPIDRVEELYLFAPLRQGAVETGIAVIAARVNVVPLDVAPDTVVDSTPVTMSSGSAPAAVESGTAAIDAVSESTAVATDTALGEAPATSTAQSEMEPEHSPDEADVAHGFLMDLELNSEEESPYAPDVVVEAPPETIEEVPKEPHFDAPPPMRHTVYTARYRLVVKGPERGKWEIDVVDEADAPLLTVETVVRGVQRRAGEETATVRYTAPQLSRALRLNPLNTP